MSTQNPTNMCRSMTSSTGSFTDVDEEMIPVPSESYLKEMRLQAEIYILRQVSEKLQPIVDQQATNQSRSSAAGPDCNSFEGRIKLAADVLHDWGCRAEHVGRGCTLDDIFGAQVTAGVAPAIVVHALSSLLQSSLLQTCSRRGYYRFIPTCQSATRDSVIARYMAIKGHLGDVQQTLKVFPFIDENMRKKVADLLLLLVAEGKRGQELTANAMVPLLQADYEEQRCRINMQAKSMEEAEAERTKFLDAHADKMDALLTWLDQNVIQPSMRGHNELIPTSAPMLAKTESCDATLRGSNICFEPWENMLEVIQDNEWHAFYEPGSKKPCDTVICLRSDGILLNMKLNQYKAWSSASDTKMRLSELAKGVSKQVENDDCPKELISSCEHQHWECPRCLIDLQSALTSESTKSATEPSASGHQVKINTSVLEYDGKNNAFSNMTLDLLQRENIQLRIILPPCYCEACSEFFWAPEGFAATLDHVTVTCIVKWLVLDISKIRGRITQSLAKHGMTLQRRWNKKSVDKRRSLLLSLFENLPSYKSLKKIIQDYDYHRAPTVIYAARKTSRNLLVSQLNLHDLVNDPAFVFKHIYARALTHPAQFFLADFLRLKSANDLEYMPNVYTFGSFNVTETQYGEWQKWEDGKIHRFEAVAAAVAPQVFEAQAQLLAMLEQFVLALQQGLQNAMVGTGTSTLSQAPTQHVHLPTHHDFESLFMMPNPLLVDLDVAQQIAHNRLTQVSHELIRLRADQSCMRDRVLLCADFLSACTHKASSEPSYLATLVFAEPHDRVLTWVRVRKLFDDLKSTKKNTALNRSEYLRKFRKLVHLLAIRGQNVVSTALAFCRYVLKRDRIIPRELRDGVEELSDWLTTLCLDSPFEMVRVIKSSFTRLHLAKLSSNTCQVHGLIKEWITEVATATRVIELLMICEPMIRLSITGEVDARRECSRQDVVDAKQRYQGITARRLRSLKGLLTKEEHASKLAGADIESLWHRYAECASKHLENEGYLQVWIEINRKVTSLTAPDPKLSSESVSDLDVKSRKPSPSKETQNARGLKCQEEAPVDTSIPHHFGPDSPQVYKLTKRKRDELNVYTPENEAATEPEQIEAEDEHPLVDPSTIEIEVKRKHLTIVERLFSNAQENVPDLRWDKFVNFMTDAGLEVKVGQGSSFTFSGKNVLDGRDTGLVLHRPHPEAVLKAVHMRNNAMKIREQFGWEEHMFIARQKN